MLLQYYLLLTLPTESITTALEATTFDPKIKVVDRIITIWNNYRFTAQIKDRHKVRRILNSKCGT